MLNFTNEYIKYLFVQITSRSVFCFLTKEVKWGLKGKTVVTRRIKSEKTDNENFEHKDCQTKIIQCTNLFPRLLNNIIIIKKSKSKYE